MKHGIATGLMTSFTAAALLLTTVLTASCEVVDDIGSQVVCADFCDKDASCTESEPSSDERNACIDDCRSSIEDTCGNENQAGANEQLAECVDLGCGEFYTCLVFDAAPECFGFVND
jgi:hypothetical protein